MILPGADYPVNGDDVLVFQLPLRLTVFLHVGVVPGSIFFYIAVFPVFSCFSRYKNVFLIVLILWLVFIMSDKFPLSEIFETVNYSGLVDKIEQDFVSRGLLKPLPVGRCQSEVEMWVDAHEKPLAAALRRNWDTLFPGVDFSEDLLQKHLREYLDDGKRELFERLTRKRKYRLLVGYLFAPEQLIFFSLLLATIILFPIFLNLFLYPSDFAMFLGLGGLLLNGVAWIIYFIRKIFINR